MSWEDIHKQLMSNLDSTLSRSLVQLYERVHIPILVRRKYSQWFVEQHWPDAMTPETAKDLYDELITSIDNDIGHLRTDPQMVLEAVELYQAKSRLEEFFFGDPVSLVQAVVACLDDEKKIISGYTGSDKMDEEEPEVKEIRDKFNKELEHLETQIMNIMTLTRKAHDHLVKSKALQQDLDGYEADRQRFLQTSTMNGNREQYAEFFSTKIQETKDIVHKHIEEFKTTKKMLESYLQESMAQLKSYTAEILEEVHTFKHMQKLMYVRAESATKVETLLREIDEWCGKLGLCYWSLLTITQNPDLVEIMSTSPEALLGEGQTPESAILLSRSQEMLTKLTEEVLTNFQNLLNETFIVTVQPPDRIIMTKERGARGSGGNSRAPLNASVSILALNCLEIQQIASRVTAEFTAEIDIGRNSKTVTCKLEGDVAQFKKTTQKRAEACFSELKVTDFTRKGKDCDEGRVSRQFYRIFFKTTVTLQSEYVFRLQTVSLPFIKNTGSNQACEALGSLLWYCYNTDDVWSNLENATFPNEVPLERVINMLNSCLKAISPRELKEDERRFLSEKITGKASKKLQDEYAPMPKVTFNQFCVNKMRINNSKSVEFSFWKWFHAVINLIDKHLKEPWKDGVIKGFVSRSTVERTLKNQPEGTFLIRFSESCVNGDHQGVTGGFVVAFKSKDRVQYTPPRVKEHLLKASLPTILSQFINIERNAEPLLKTLYRSSCHKETRDNAFQKYKIQCEKSNYSGYPGWIALMGLECSLQDLVLDDKTYDSSQDMWKNNEQPGISYPTPTRPLSTRTRAKKRRMSNEESQSLSPPTACAKDSTMDSFSSNSPGSGNIPTTVQDMHRRPPSTSSISNDIEAFLNHFGNSSVNQQASTVPIPTCVPNSQLLPPVSTFTMQDMQATAPMPSCSGQQMEQVFQHHQLMNNSSPQSATSSSTDYNTDSPSPPGTMSSDLISLDPSILFPMEYDQQQPKKFLELLNRF